MKPTLYIIRSFWDSRPPEDMMKLLDSNAGETLSSFMRGYAWRVVSDDPVDPAHIGASSSVHQEGTYRYIGICVLPTGQMDRAAEITARSGLTGKPEIDRLSEPKPLTEIRDNPIIIDDFPVSRFMDNLAVFFENNPILMGQEAVPHFIRNR
jgi:hypothetical protein